MKVFQKITKHGEKKYCFFGLPLFKKIKNENKKGNYICGIPIIKTKNCNTYTKKYILGFRIKKKKKKVLNIESINSNTNIYTKDPVLRLEGMKLILEREKITFGDKI